MWNRSYEQQHNRLLQYFDLCAEVVPTADISSAFKDIDVAILVGAMPRREGMERKDLLKANVRIFKQQGEALNQFAKKTVKASSSYYSFFIKVDFFKINWTNL